MRVAVKLVPDKVMGNEPQKSEPERQAETANA